MGGLRARQVLVTSMAGSLSPPQSPQWEPCWVWSQPHGPEFPFGGCCAVPSLGENGERGWLPPSATRAGGADTRHRGTVTPQAGMWKEGSSAGQAGEGVPAGRAPGTTLPDVGWVPVGHPGRFWGHCPHTAPYATACPGHNLGLSLLPRGCQGHVGAHHRCPRAHRVTQRGVPTTRRWHRLATTKEPMGAPVPGQVGLPWPVPGPLQCWVPAPPMMAAPQGGLVGVPFARSLSPQWPSPWH